MGDNSYNISREESLIVPHHHAAIIEVGDNEPDWRYHDQHPCARCNRFWLPRQEDWVDIYEQTHSTNWIETFNKFSFFLNRFGTKIFCYCKTYSELITIAWCLFVHKEVYGLTWDWNNKKWVSIDWQGQNKKTIQNQKEMIKKCIDEHKKLKMSWDVNNGKWVKA